MQLLFLAEDYPRCPGNFCLGMVEFNCCNSMDTLEIFNEENEGKCLSKRKKESDQENDFIEEAPRKKAFIISRKV